MRKKGIALQFCRFQFEVPWVRYNAQLLYPQLSCHHEPALKGLLRNCKTKEHPHKLKPLQRQVGSLVIFRCYETYLFIYLRPHWSARSLDRAEKSIKAYELEAIADSEKAFIRAVTRRPECSNLPYFFGILKRIQQERDDEAYRRYCQERYNYNQLLETQKRRQELQEQNEGPTVESIVGMLENAVSLSSRFLKERAARMGQQWTEELKKNFKNLGSLRKQLSDAVGKLNHLTLEKKENIWNLVDQCFNPNSTVQGVTLTT